MFPGDPRCVLIALDGPGLDSACLDGPIYIAHKMGHFTPFELKKGYKQALGPQNENICRLDHSQKASGT